MSSPLVLFQPPSVNDFCWQLGGVMAVIVLGCGVAGLSVLAYALHSIRPHPSRRHFLSHPRFCLFAPHAQALGDFGLMQTISWLHEFAKTPTLSKFASSRFCCSSSRRELLSLLTHSKLGAVLLLLPTISCREPFHAQELGAVCVNFSFPLTYLPWTD